ncbi:MAG: DUF2809 domain-containing protein [Planctomycetes bacterium]|nr:DUF2809 domain-containing protein [Planctomycetota bacterium]
MSRRRALAALAVTIAAGLASRRWPLPGLLAEHAGDALYATAVFFVLACGWPSTRPRTLAAVALALAFAVECAQLLPWPWLVAWRQTRVGALLLGQGFQVADLCAQVAGVALALAGWWRLSRPCAARRPGSHPRTGRS